MLADRVGLVSTVMRVRDVGTAATWYRDHLGVEVGASADGRHPIATFSLGPNLVSLWQLESHEDAPRGSISDPYLVLVLTDGLDDVRAQLDDEGVDVTPVSEQSNLTRFFRFTDLDGNIVEVAEPRQQT